MRGVARLSVVLLTATACNLMISRSSPEALDCSDFLNGSMDQEFRVTMVEYEIRGLPTTLREGASGMCVENNGTVTHDLRISPVKEGRTLEEILTPEISHKDLPLGGLLGTSVAPGQFNDFGIAFDPGPHAYACFRKDPSGRTHASLGMRGGFTVT